MVKFKWTIRLIAQSAMFVALWPVLGWMSIRYRVFSLHGGLPIFYLLIWIIGLVCYPKQAFWISFLGHLLFDIWFYFSPLFIFMWLSSAISSWLIAKLRKIHFEFLMVIVMPILSLLAFFIMANFYFPNNFWTFFGVNLPVTFIIILINPLFNCLLYYYFIINKRIRYLINYLRTLTFN